MTVSIDNKTRYVLDRVFQNAHEVLYEGVEAPSAPSYIPLNVNYKALVDNTPQPPPGPPVPIPDTTRSSSRVSAVALAEAMSPNCYTARGTTDVIIAPAGAAILVATPSLSFSAPAKRLFVNFMGAATSAVADAQVTLSLIVGSLPHPVTYTFTVVASTTRTPIHGMWAADLPTTTSASTFTVRAANGLASGVATFLASYNQVIGIYG